jgi:hypothetical protein
MPSRKTKPKAEKGSLTPEQAQALAWELVAPLLERPAGFESKHTFTRTNVAARVGKIDWFANVGEPLTLDLTMPVERVANWKDAAKAISEPAWENGQLEAANQLTAWLSDNAQKAYDTKWNRLVGEQTTKVLAPAMKKSLRPFAEKNHLPRKVLESVGWDVVHALMENAFLATGHRCFFFLELLTVYEAGHFPCGWRGEWPNGKLLVF